MTGTPNLSTNMINGSFFTDDYGNLVVFKNSEDNSNNVPTKTWVENYVGQHGEDVPNGIVVKTSTNAKNLSVNSIVNEIASFNVLSTDDTKAIINLTVPYTSDISGIVVVSFYINGVLDEGSIFRQPCNKGYNTFTLTNYYEMPKNNRVTFSIKIKTESYISDVEKNSAKIESIINYIKTNEYIDPVLEENIPTIDINKQTVKAVLFAQGIAGEGQWDGTLNFVEELNVTPVISRIEIGEMKENISAKHVSVNNTFIEAQFDAIHSGGVYGIGNITETVSFITDTENANYVEEVLSPIIIGEQKLMIGAISDAINISTTEE